MGKNDNEIICYADCICGCGDFMAIKRWHLYPAKGVPNHFQGHNQENNKRGWKGGKLKDVNGYILVYSPTHPFRNVQGKGYVKRGRLVIESVLDRFLNKSEVVHHINGIRDDDRPENLRVMSIPEHLSLHHKGRPKKRDSLGKFI